MLTIPTALAASEDGQLVEESFEEVRRRFHDLDASGVEQFVTTELAATRREASGPGWDGHNGEPVSGRAIELAELFVRRLPLGFPLPTSGAEPDGHVTLEWYRGASRMISVSVDPTGWLHFACIKDVSRTDGMYPFVDEVPAELLDLIEKVCA